MKKSWEYRLIQTPKYSGLAAIYYEGKDIVAIDYEMSANFFENSLEEVVENAEELIRLIQRALSLEPIQLEEAGLHPLYVESPEEYELIS